MRIVSVAIKVNGLIMSLPAPNRHFHVLKAMPQKWARKVLPNQQGFLTNEGQWLGREEALTVAHRAGQLLKPTEHRELFSEDLW